MSGETHGVRPAGRPRVLSAANLGASAKAEACQPPSILVAARSAFIPPAKKPQPAKVPDHMPRCSEKGCVFPAIWGETGRCRQHDRQYCEPALFRSQQPTMLLLDRAKFGMLDSESEQQQAGSRDRRRLAKLREAFLEGVA
jgi:hypothetical protein